MILLALPTMTEEILATLLQYVDTAMVGHLGERATASVSVTTTIGWLVGSIAYSLGAAVLALVARAYGAQDRNKAARLANQALLLTIFSGIVLGAVSIALSPFIPGWMGAEEAVRKQASLYFLIISIPMIFRTSTAILGSAVRATQNTKTPMLITLASNILNMVLNYLLIYTAGLGVTGAAIATAVSYTVGGILMLMAFLHTGFLYPQQKGGRTLRGWGVSLLPDLPILQEVCVIALPILGTSVVNCAGYVVFAGMVSGMGTTIFAAHSIAVTAEQLFYIPGYGLRTATSALVGAALGEKNDRKLTLYCRIAVSLTLLMSCLSGVILFFAAVPLMRLFTPSAAVVELGSSMLKLVAFSEPFFGLMVVMEGIQYGMGSTRYPFLVESLSMWGVRILFTYLTVCVWHLGLREVWYCMIADNVCKALLLSLPAMCGKLHIQEQD